VRTLRGKEDQEESQEEKIAFLGRYNTYLPCLYLYDKEILKLKRVFIWR